VGIVFTDLRRLQRLVVEEVRPEMVDDGIEGQSVAKAIAQVSDMNIVVFSCHLGTPNLQRSQAFLLNGCHDLVMNHAQC